jgi:small-conductance mechanosensitive channel
MADKPQPKNPDGPVTDGATQRANPSAVETENKDTEDKDKGLSQSEVNRILAREKRRWQQELDQKASEAKEQADKEAAEKTGQFETLYKTEQAKVKTLQDQLKARDTELETLRDTVSKGIDVQVKDWPDEVLALDPKRIDGDNYSLQARIDWVNRARKLADKLAGTPPPPGNGPHPVPSNGGARPQVDPAYTERAKQRHEFIV